MNGSMPRELLERLLPLLSSLCEDEEDGRVVAELAQILEEDPSARWVYICYTQLHAHLKLLCEEGRLGGEDSIHETVAECLDLIQGEAHRNEESRVGSPGEGGAKSDDPVATVLGLEASRSLTEGSGDVTQGNARFLRLNYVSWGAASICVLAGAYLLASWASFPFGSQDSQPLNLAEGFSGVARLEGVQECLWEGAAEPIVVGASFDPGDRLSLAQGVAKLRFAKGTVVFVESPAEFEVVSDAAMRILEGTFVARVTGEEKEFQVISPDAEIVDLGTSFGVHCKKGAPTEVEVFEGAVEIHSADWRGDSKVVGMGSSVQITKEEASTRFEVAESDETNLVSSNESTEARFSRLLKLLWEDIRKTPDMPEGNDSLENNSIVAEFDSAPVDGTIDTFNRSSAGKGWVTPWFGTGNVQGDVRLDRALGKEGDRYLSFRFSRACYRTIGREYGARNEFDPFQPHVISWKWRFEGDLEAFRARYVDRVAFYGNPYFRRLSWEDNTWFVGVTGGSKRRKPNYEANAMEWFVFDGKNGNQFHRDNLKGTGVMLRKDVTYRFTVVVYPNESLYDVAIQTEDEDFSVEGLSFRNKNSASSANVLHFGMRAWRPGLDIGFSLDSIRIQSLESVRARGDSSELGGADL